MGRKINMQCIHARACWRVKNFADILGVADVPLDCANCLEYIDKDIRLRVYRDEDLEKYRQMLHSDEFPIYISFGYAINDLLNEACEKQLNSEDDIE